MGFAREYVEGDADDLVERLRVADKQEIQAIVGGDADLVAIVAAGAHVSVPVVTIVGNKGYVAGMFGVVPQPDGSGCVWLVGTDELVSPPLSRQFIRECRTFAAQLERGYTRLHNVMDERNTIHRRWLEWLGFEFFNRIPEYGVERRPFLEFRKPCVWQAGQQHQARVTGTQEQTRQAGL